MADPDDILSSLGGSLMQDLLNDISSTTNNNGSNNKSQYNYFGDDNNLMEDDNTAMLSTLAMLERELDGPTMSQDDDFLKSTITSTSTTATAASWVVSSSSSSTLPPPPMMNQTIKEDSNDNNSSPMDAWALSLSKFSTLNLEQDFIQADRLKKTATATPPVKKSVPSTNFEDYDLSSVPPPPPGMTLSTMTATTSTTPQKLPPPKTPTASFSSPPQMLPNHHPPSIPSPAATAGTVLPPPGVLPPHSVHPNIKNSTAMPPQSLHNMNRMPPPIGFAAAAGMPPPPHMVVAPPPPQRSPATLSSNLFANPDYNAPPVPAKATSCMTPRDILTVVHASLRPLYAMMHYVNDPQKGGTVSHHADFYYTQFNKQQQHPHHHLLFTTPNGRMTNPKKDDETNEEQPKQQKEQQEQREQIALREQNFVVTTEKRAMNWSKDQQTLGQVVKTNVYRPRALLSVPTKVLRGKQKEEDDNDVHGTTLSSSARNNMWKARLLTDRGYNAMLELLELRTIFAAPTNNQEDDNQRRQQYLPQVQRHIDTLHKTFGMYLNNNKMVVNESVLALTLSLPKGRTLLARLFHLAVLPHDSARIMLPTLCKVVFCDYKPPNNNNTVMMINHPYGRLLQAMIGLVRTIHPSVQREDLFRSLDTIINNASENSSSSNDFIQTIANSQPHMKLLHAILTRCQQICPPHDLEWKQREQAIMAKLNNNNSIR